MLRCGQRGWTFWPNGTSSRRQAGCGRPAVGQRRHTPPTRTSSPARWRPAPAALLAWRTPLESPACGGALASLAGDAPPAGRRCPAVQRPRRRRRLHLPREGGDMPPAPGASGDPATAASTPSPRRRRRPHRSRLQGQPPPPPVAIERPPDLANCDAGGCWADDGQPPAPGGAQHGRPQRPLRPAGGRSSSEPKMKLIASKELRK